MQLSSYQLQNSTLFYLILTKCCNTLPTVTLHIRNNPVQIRTTSGYPDFSGFPQIQKMPSHGLLLTHKGEVIYYLF